MKIKSQIKFETFFGEVPLEGLFTVCTFGHFFNGFHYNFFFEGFALWITYNDFYQYFKILKRVNRLYKLNIDTKEGSLEVPI
jgi:hypothetical protein